MSSGVKVPWDIAFQLSVGLHYMFHLPMNKNLLKDAWMDFQRRLRWWLKFMIEKKDNLPYDPDYDI